MLKFKVKIKHKGEPDSQAWEEEYDTEKSRWMEKYAYNYDTPDEYGNALVDFWNAGLKPYQKPREFVSAKKIDENEE